MKRPISFLVAAGALAATGCTQQAAPPVASAPAAPATSVAAVPRVEPSPAVRDAQLRLRALGYYDGAVDGLWGPESRQALLDFQRDQGIAASGELNGATTTALRDESVPPRRA